MGWRTHPLLSQAGVGSISHSCHQDRPPVGQRGRCFVGQEAATLRGGANRKKPHPQGVLLPGPPWCFLSVLTPPSCCTISSVAQNH